MSKQRRQVLALDIAGLKCDRHGCGWRDDIVKAEDYPAYVNAACPKCGSNVLTLADFKTAVRITLIVAWVNRWFWWWPGKREWVSREFEMDGTGRAVAKKPNPYSEPTA